MIRAAEHSDTKGIVALLQAIYRTSIYVEIGEVDVLAATNLTTSLIQLMGQRGAHSSLVWVAVEGDEICGLFMGMRAPIYHIGTKRQAQEVFFIGDRDKVNPTDMVALFRRFLTWAESDPDVAEIKVSTTDIFRWQDWRELRPFYEKRGFILSGEVFVRRVKP